MQIPVVEQIARRIEARLESVQLGARPDPGDPDSPPYQLAIRRVVRPTRRELASPHNGTTYLELEAFEEGEAEIATRGTRMGRTAVWAVHHYLEPSDDDDRPLNLLQAIAIAEIERALAADFYPDTAGTFAGPGGFAGLGHSAELRLPEMFVTPTAEQAGVVVRLAVSYYHTDLDPYTPLN